MKKIVLILTLVALTTAAGHQGLHWWQHGRFQQSTDNAYLQGDITRISAKLAGYVVETRVTDNQRLQAGDIIAVIEDSEFRARVAQAEAAYQGAEAALVRLSARQRLQQSRIREAEADIRQKSAELKRVSQQLDRTRALLTRDYAAQDDLDNHQLAKAAASAALDNSRARLEAEQQQLTVLSAEQHQLQAQRQQHRAALELTRIDLANTVIRAPVDGIVGDRTLRAGQYIQPGQALISLVPSRRLWVEANFKETQLESMRTGQPVTLTIDAFPNQPIPARISSIAPATGAQFSLLPPENATGNFTKVVQRLTVRIDIPEDSPLQQRLAPGMSVYASVDTRPAQG